VRRGAAAWAIALALAGAVAPLRASGHEVLHEVQRGRAVALRAWFPDGEPLAYVQAEVYSPADPRIAHWKGRTDRNGWLSFVPDVPGRWRVRVIDASGHGLDTGVDVALPGTGAGAPAACPGQDAPASPAGTAAFVLRPVVGAVLIAAIFGSLYLYRRRRTP
jgi:nickel transport protein